MEMHFTAIQEWADAKIAQLEDSEMTPANLDLIIKLQQLKLQVYQQITLDCMYFDMPKHGSPDDSTTEIKKIGEVYVDAGLVYIGDPCYVWPDEDKAPALIEKVGTWQQLCAKLDDLPYPHRYNFDGLGVIATSGMGDGIYPVYAEIENETIKRITIDFLLDSDDDDEEDEGVGASGPNHIAAVRGAIIGALAGGHMEGPEGADYSKALLLNIADLLGLAIPDKIKDGTWREE